MMLSSPLPFSRLSATRLQSLFNHTLILLFVFYSALTHASLTLATWNMEWLSEKGDMIQSKREDQDYLMMNTINSVLDADLLAFQEVDSIEALSRVVNPDLYDYYFSDRAERLGFSRRSQQYTGWAVKKNLDVIDRQDYQPLGLPTFLSAGDLRYGAYIEVKRDGLPPLHLLSIHLKSGCFETPVRRNNSCKKLDHQIEALIIWIQTRIRLGQEFVIAGDFNHYLNESNEWVWDKLEKEIGQGNLVKLTENTPAKCKARKFNYRTKRWEHVVYSKLIDHIIASKGALSSMSIPQAKQYQFSYHAVATYRLSDHCPIIVNL